MSKEALTLALEALETELAVDMTNGAEVGAAAELMCEAITALKKALAKQEQGEPLEYWNAVEGWVKIDEVREHFDSVSCGTIYKNGGEGRVPLCLAQQRTWVGLTDEEREEIALEVPMDAVCITEAKLKQKNT
jgi:hypothetical protein